MSQRTYARNRHATLAREMIELLQQYFVDQLSQHGAQLKPHFMPFTPMEWLRNEGLHGGGVRYVAQDALFNRASVNMSQVSYEDDASKPLQSATALSAIIHPTHPKAPSVHMHVSWTQLKSQTGYWRIMADLNPALDDPADKQTFSKSLRAVAGKHFDEAIAQGDQYFFIPSLNRHRGICHFYLEGFDSGDWQTDKTLAENFATTVINTYCEIFSKNQPLAVSSEDKQQQLDYHSLYVFQVLTLDRGTTSGLLAHNNNDVGTLAHYRVL